MLLYSINFNCGEVETDLCEVKSDGTFLENIALRSKRSFLQIHYVSEAYKTLLVSDNCVSA